MIKRRKTKTIKAGPLKIGSSAPIVIQSMTKVPTIDIARCLKQINQLAHAGCRLVRIAVPTRADTAAFAKIVQKVSVPLIADIHFSANRAIEAIEAGAAKIRLNPGNIKNPKDIHRIINAAKMHKTAIRIGDKHHCNRYQHQTHLAVPHLVINISHMFFSIRISHNEI